MYSISPPKTLRQLVRAEDFENQYSLSYKLEIDGLATPTVLVYAPGEKRNVYYLGTQPGVIYRIDSSSKTVSRFLDIKHKIPTIVNNLDKRGLLGLAFHPNYSTNRLFYVFYSCKLDPNLDIQTPDGFDPKYYNCLSQFKYDEESQTVKPESEVLVLRIPMNYITNNGGEMEFEPMTFNLVIAVGDGSDNEDTLSRAQNISLVYGKILRIDLTSPATLKIPYRIPKDNPFSSITNGTGATFDSGAETIDTPVKGVKIFTPPVPQNFSTVQQPFVLPKKDISRKLPEIYAVGFRNPTGLGFDGVGRLFVSDVGYGITDRVNIVTKGGNYGWNVKEGSNITPWTHGKSDSYVLFKDPIFEIPTEINKTISGGFPLSMTNFSDFTVEERSFYTFSLGPETYLIEEFPSRWQIVGKSNISCSSFGRDGFGNIYLLIPSTNPSSKTGQVFRIEWSPLTGMNS